MQHATSLLSGCPQLAVWHGLQEQGLGCCCWLCNIVGRLSSISATSTARHARPILLCCLSASWLQHCRPSEPHQPGMANGRSTKPGGNISFLCCRLLPDNIITAMMEHSALLIRLCVSAIFAKCCYAITKSQQMSVLKLRVLCIADTLQLMYNVARV